ncbi:hypothetical protein IFM89_016286 [Coptis chinensis]|uniref:Uncharacterized protein n=1 Tax=Coptis chinensis TaxID=261450 RepID=A0A835HMI6_9MAGN|nr:hypothetical protein IFM89_016286 [Coptis chinensis]
MDSKVKAMINLIEEDADSFARRIRSRSGEHSVGPIGPWRKRFPTKFPLCASMIHHPPRIEMKSRHSRDDRRHVRASLDPDDLQKDALGLPSSQFTSVSRNGAYSDEYDHFISKKGLKQLNELFGSGERRVRKGLHFHDDD